jgi:multiple sugar transport system substrate-binding protein
MDERQTSSVSRREVLRGSLISLAAAAVGSSVLGACASDSKGANGGGKKAIRFSASAEPIADYIRDKIVPDFKAKTGISVTVDATDYTKMHAKQVLQLGSDQYDVYQVDQVWVQEYAKSGFLKPLDSYAKSDVIKNFFPNLVQIGNVDGKQWTLPLSAIPVDYYYREDLLQAAGMKPADTWDEVLQIAEATKKDGRYGFAVRGERGNPITWTWLPMLWAFGGDTFDSSQNPVYNSEAGIASVEFFKKLYETSPPGFLSAQDVAAAMQQDKAAQTTLMSVYNAAMNDASQSKVAGKIKFGEMPQKEKRASILGMWTIGMGAKSSKQDEAWQFIDHLSSPEIATKMALAGPVGATQPATYSDPKAPEYFPVLGKVLGYAQPPPLIAQGDKWFDITGSELQNAVSGNKSPKKAMDDAASQVKAMLKG